MEGELTSIFSCENVNLEASIFPCEVDGVDGVTTETSDNGDELEELEDPFEPICSSLSNLTT